jgi:predicted TIM-barrel fold metal-dependent hydrolase
LYSRRSFLAAASAAATGVSAAPQALNPNTAANSPLIPEDLVIWDLHSHLTNRAYATPSERMAQLIRYADRMHIERLVLSLGAPLLENPTPEQLRDANNQVLEVLRQWPQRAVGLVYLNPSYPAFILEEFDRCVRDGPMVGVKLWVAKRCDTPDLDALAERAASLGAIIYQHTWLKTGGNLPGESTPFDVASLAARHPRATIICGHTGGDWERGIRAIRNSPNVPIDIAGSDPTAGFTEMAVRELGAERILYGSDVPGRSFASQLAKVLGAEIPMDAKRLIAGGNLKRLLSPILQAKGIRI